MRDEQGTVSKIALPVYGTGLWSMIYAFLALDSKGNMVKGITYYDHGETTPGLGVKLKTLAGVSSGLAKSCLMTTVSQRDSCGERRGASRR